MGCCRIVFGLILIIRTIIHLRISVFAAMDLSELRGKTSEFNFNLGFYIFCGVYLLVLLCVFPWTSNTGCCKIMVYTILQLVYIGTVFYVAFKRTAVDMTVLRKAYQIMARGGILPASLVFDVMTLVSAFAAEGVDSVGSEVIKALTG